MINQAAQARPDAVAGLIYLSAILVPEGLSKLDFLVGYNASLGRRVATPQPTADGLALELTAADVRGFPYQESSADNQDWAVSRVRPEPIAPNAVPVHLTADRFGTVHRAYIETDKDLCLGIDKQRQQQADFRCDPVITLSQADHLAFVSAPDALVDALNSMADAWQLKSSGPQRLTGVDAAGGA